MKVIRPDGPGEGVLWKSVSPFANCLQNVKYKIEREKERLEGEGKTYS